MEEMTVTIPLERCESLLGIETRALILADYIKRSSYADRETMMRILGYPDEADKIAAQVKEERESFSMNDAVGGIIEDAGTD